MHGYCRPSNIRRLTFQQPGRGVEDLQRVAADCDFRFVRRPRDRPAAAGGAQQFLAGEGVPDYEAVEAAGEEAFAVLAPGEAAD